MFGSNGKYGQTKFGLHFDGKNTHFTYKTKPVLILPLNHFTLCSHSSHTSLSAHTLSKAQLWPFIHLSNSIAPTPPHAPTRQSLTLTTQAICFLHSMVSFLHLFFPLNLTTMLHRCMSPIHHHHHPPPPLSKLPSSMSSDPHPSYPSTYITQSPFWQTHTHLTRSLSPHTHLPIYIYLFYIFIYLYTLIFTCLFQYLFIYLFKYIYLFISSFIHVCARLLIQMFTIVVWWSNFSLVIKFLEAYM